ncbi:heterokaryon incompatibility protein-domain-containing protein [Pyrenochaeta sp. MPI-SDFR-AT-0127]|nr:heterokaryon incompatibility protein-domain-containing protein [Pyrenochaeta sp. MPI-SDFR-AT-0127]
MTFHNYAYEPLAPTLAQFRLIRLRPSNYAAEPNYSSADGMAELSSATLVFDALSYCWGAPNFTHCVVVDLENGTRCQIKITESLQQTLLHIQELDVDILVFIDQLSINQNDIPVKNHQVSLMDDVCSKAIRVFAWLGPSTPESDDFLDGMALKRCNHVESTRKKTTANPNTRPFGKDAVYDYVHGSAGYFDIISRP